MKHLPGIRSIFLILVVLLGAIVPLRIASSAHGQTLLEGAPQAAAAATIQIEAASAGISVNPNILGSNLPTWLGSYRFQNTTFQTRAAASGLTIVRMPGGSWSNTFNWYNCEMGLEYCSWASRPTDFIDYMQATGFEGMWTINQNETSKHAAALVAFMNGSVDDERVIGVDVRGYDWGKVSDWAKLRRDHGNPDPIHIQYWEIGNETYGGQSGAGTDCYWGWEEVWTCNGTEYVQGIGSGADRKEGYLEFRAAMRAVDPTILVGAVGLNPAYDSWFTDWGKEVIAAAGDVMDFYIIHEYGDVGASVASDQEILARPQQLWGPMMDALNQDFDNLAGGRRVPIAVTEYNLFAWESDEHNAKMSQFVNGVFIADSIGQMIANGIVIANQWNLAHNYAGLPAGYGMLNADDYTRFPQYYVFPLWAKFGASMLPLTNSLSAETTLSAYAGKVDADTFTVLAINKTGQTITAQIKLNGIETIVSGKVDVLRANALDDTSVTFNGVSNPTDDLSNAPSLNLAALGNPLTYDFPPYSVTVLTLNSDTQVPNPTPTPTPPPVVYSHFIYLPFIPLP